MDSLSRSHFVKWTKNCISLPLIIFFSKISPLIYINFYNFLTILRIREPKLPSLWHHRQPTVRPIRHLPLRPFRVPLISLFGVFLSLLPYEFILKLSLFFRLTCWTEKLTIIRARFGRPRWFRRAIHAVTYLIHDFGSDSHQPRHTTIS